MSLSPLGLVNLLSPKDTGSQRLASNVAYGPLGRQRLDIYGPAVETGPTPVILFFYGGSWSDGDKGNYGFAGRALASLGYTVIVPDYRLLPEVEYPEFLIDCCDAVAWASTNAWQYGGNGSRIGLIGHSAGAYNAMMLAVDPTLLDARGIMPAVKCVAGLSGPYDFFPFDGPISLRTFGAVREPHLTQPINHVRAGLKPAFLACGGRDTLVLPRNSLALADRLRQTEVPVRVKVYERLGHAETLLALTTWLRFMAPALSDLDDFLASFLRPDQSSARSEIS